MTRARHALLTLATGASLSGLVFASACSGATPRDINDRDAESAFEPPAAIDAGDAGDSAGTAGSGGAAGSAGAAGSDGTAGAGASGSGGAAGAVSDGGDSQ